MQPLTDPCPCGRSRSFDACCGVLLAGGAARTAEDLMRSRFTAFARDDAAYLLHSWDPETQPPDIPPDPTVRWLSLEIIDTIGGKVLDPTGTVEFIARFTNNSHPGAMRERSRFRRHQGRWVYLDGDSIRRSR